MKRLAFFVAAALLCIGIAQAKKPDNPGGGGGGGGPEYHLITLAPPEIAISGSLARDLDKDGNVVGFYDAAGQSFGFYYDFSQDDWLLFGAGIRVLGLNDFGEMVGRDDNSGEGLYWRSPDDQNPIALRPLNGHQDSVALRINCDGIIIGESYGDAQGVAAVSWAVDAAGVVSAPLELPRLEDDTFGSVEDLNEADPDGVTQIVGASGVSYPGDAAIRWEVEVVGGVPVLVSGPSDLGALDSGSSVAYGINFFGDVVGQSSAWPFVKPVGQTMQPLAGIRKAANGIALGINDQGTIVGDQGYLWQGNPVFKAVLWTADGSVRELDKTVPLGTSEALESASRINNAGQVIGSGYFPAITNADNVAFLLVPNE